MIVDAFIAGNPSPNQGFSALVLCGDGINCERETASALALAGFDPRLVHVNALIDDPGILNDMDLMAIPGGFSFGDELGSGQVLATKLKARVAGKLSEFVGHRKPVIGICNGFQVLVKLGLLPSPRMAGQVALATNSSGQFQNHWVTLEAPDSRCIWTKGLRHAADTPLQMPIRHGEGRLLCRPGSDAYAVMESEGMIALRYTDDINGSIGRIAGICDPTGVVFGLMPHPEAALHDWLHPSRCEGSARGLELFKNAFDFVANNRRKPS